MIIAQHKVIEPTLFAAGSDLRFRTFAQTRNFVGDFFEAAAAELTGARRIKTDSSADICPDLEHKPNVYIENKSIGNSGSIIVYEHRAAKDDRFLAEQQSRRLFYFLWRHTCPAGTMRTLYELRRELAQNVSKLLIVDWASLRAVLSGLSIKPLNKGKKTPAGARLGYGTNGYGDGWSVRYSLIEKLATVEKTSHELTVYGERVLPFTICAIDRAHLEWSR